MVWFLKNNIGAGGVRGLRDTRRTSAATGDSELRAESSQRERRSALRVSGLASRGPAMWRASGVVEVLEERVAPDACDLGDLVEVEPDFADCRD